MKARVIIRNDAPEGTTLLPDGTDLEGELIFVNSPTGYGRLAILVDEGDALEVVRQPTKGYVTVHDMLTDAFHHIARADCGAGCFCGAQIVP